MSKKKKTEVVRHGDSGIINIQDTGVYAFQIGASTTENWIDQLTSYSNSTSTVSWESEKQIVQGKEIVPYGTNNNLPAHIRKIMDDNNLAPAILEREIGLLWGLGPQLYQDVWENGDYKREWTYDPQVWSFLNDFDLEYYLTKATAEFKFLKGIFNKFILNKGLRIGKKGRINAVECVPGTDARLAWVNTRRLEDIKKIYVGDFENDCSTGIKTYPVFDPQDPFKSPVSMRYYNQYSFARNFYAVPSYYGALNWIQRSSDIPEIIKYLTDNSLNIGHMVYSPAQYWEERREKLQNQYIDKDDKWIDKKLSDLKDEVFGKLSEVMSGKKNMGKFFESVIFYDDNGNECKWQVEPLDQKTKDIISAQIEISKKADSATTSGMSIHPSLSNIMVDGKLSSGSEMLYALKLYLASDTAIPEVFIMQAINEAIKINFPDKNIKLGFYHKVVLREEDTTPQDRVQKQL